MPALISNKFRIDNARDFRDILISGSVYAVIGKTLQWEDSLDPTINDGNPPVPYASVNALNYQIWRDALAAKSVEDNISMVFRRNDWVSGTRYDVYDDTDEALLEKNFIVITDEFNVYMCVERPVAGDSTVKPTGVSTDTIFSAVDRYRWKYLFTIPAVSAIKYLNTSFAPVKTLASDPMDGSVGSNQWAVQAAAINGGILAVNMTNEGTGYTTATVTITGDGTGATALATIESGQIKYITVTNPGSGYTFANVSIVGDGGGATAFAAAPPPGGLGADPEADTGAYYTMLYVRFNKNELDFFPIGNDYRQVFYVRNPIDANTSLVAAEPLYKQTYIVELSGVSGTVTIDDTFTAGNVTGHVVSVDGDTVELSGVAGNLVTGPITFTSATATILSIVEPELVKYSGSVILIENRGPLTRAGDQAEEFRATVQF